MDNIEAELGDESSEFFSSEEDDKDDPNFWRRDHRYDALPKNVQHAIDVSREKAKHSEFYYRLKGLNEKIYTYKQIFYDKIPAHQKRYMMKQLQKKQEQQMKEKLKFEKEPSPDPFTNGGMLNS